MATGCAFAEESVSTISGTVFLDENGNGEFDPGEKGLGGVAVSDGEVVVRTDERGLYTLKGGPEKPLVFITQPTGCRVVKSCYHHLSEQIAGQETFNFAMAEDLASLRKDFVFVVSSDTRLMQRVEKNCGDATSACP